MECLPPPEIELQGEAYTEKMTGHVLSSLRDIHLILAGWCYRGLSLYCATIFYTLRLKYVFTR